jgi:hypothetical protein
MVSVVGWPQNPITVWYKWCWIYSQHVLPQNSIYFKWIKNMCQFYKIYYNMMCTHTHTHTHTHTSGNFFLPIGFHIMSVHLNSHVKTKWVILKVYCFVTMKTCKNMWRFVKIYYTYAAGKFIFQFYKRHMSI